MLGKEGERLRWFLLPSEAAQLLSGKQSELFPLLSPFTPPQWQNGLLMSQGTNLPGAVYVEPSDKTSVSSLPNCSSTVLNGGEVVHNMAECSVGVNGKIDEDFVYNGGIYDEQEGRDLLASPAINKNQNTVPVGDAKSLGNDRHISAKMETEVRDSRRCSKDYWGDEMTVGKTLAETVVCGFSASEDEIEISFSDATPGSSLPEGNEALKKESKTIEQCPSEGKAAATDSESLTDAVVVCERKPRKKKLKEAIAGKPQFHPPPKATFKPAVQVKIQIRFKILILLSQIKVWCTAICMIHFDNVVKVLSQVVEAKRFRNSNEGNLYLSVIS